ncbi:MAG: cation transporter [Deltaproteobacteria bacterium]|nr:cation transporter [Deltaproteobacteria bacterium]MBW2498052.1 cation transporter [Deltaproteobacteria bacterium]
MTTTSEPYDRRLRAGRLALLVGILIFTGKFAVYTLTGSTALFADAMESTVNVVAAAMMVLALRLAAKPPDENHPYGHGKVEFVSAGIEGAAIGAAALVILAESVRDLVEGPSIERLGLGMGLASVLTVINGVLGVYLIRTGRSTRSIALEADGRHVLTDVWTSVGVIAGLVVVHWTGWLWVDPMMAIAVALNVVREGAGLLRRAFEGLMDHADPEALDHAVEKLSALREPTWIDVHGLRSWRSGARPHFDLHVVVPRYMDVESLHRVHDRIEDALLAGESFGGDVVVHFDPCLDDLCERCAVAECPIRSANFRVAPPETRDHYTRTDDQVQGELRSY